MKKGKRLLTFLIVTLTMLFAFTLTSFAQSNTFQVVVDDGSTTGHTLGTVTMDANDITYDGEEHIATVTPELENQYLINYEELGTTPVTNNTSGNDRYNAPYRIAVGPTKYYKQNGEGQWDALADGKKPKDAGNYMAEVTVYKYSETVTPVGSGSNQYRHDYYRSELKTGNVTFRINPKPIRAVWGETSFDYDGQDHLPTAKAVDVDNNDIELDVEVTGGPTTTIDGVKYAIKANKNNQTYTATATLPGDEGEAIYYRNYVLASDSATSPFRIAKSPVSLSWYRDANDEYGEPVDGKVYLAATAPDSDGIVTTDKIRLVYTSRKQAPKCEVSNVFTQKGRTTADDVSVVVKTDPTSAIDVDTNYDASISTGLQGADAGNYYVDTTEGTYYSSIKFDIVRRPVVLKWLVDDGKMPEPQVIEYKSDGVAYFTTYNGEAQKYAYVEIANIQSDKDDKIDDCWMTVNYYGKYKDEFDSDGIKPVAEGRQGIDAAGYKLEAQALQGNDKSCYTYKKLDPDNNTPADDVEDILVAGKYRIKELPVEIAWEPPTLGKFTYNGKHQAPLPKVTNLMPADSEDKDDCEVSEVKYSAMEGPDHNPKETIDSDMYMVEATKLNNHNYTLRQDKDHETPKVDSYNSYYAIYPLPVEIKWSPDSDFTYNASKQGVSATITNKIKAVHRKDIDDVDVVLGGIYEEANAGSYTAKVPKLKGEQKRNYTLYADLIHDDEKTLVPGSSHNWKINKKALTVTVYDKVGYYGDDPATYEHGVKYTGLVNGDTNKDDNHNNTDTPGRYTPTGGSEKDVVEGTLNYDCAYKQYGKAGNYSVSASGLTADNYNITYVPGTLTVKNRILSNELVAKAVAGNKMGTVYWQKVSGASKYQVYVSLCNTKTKRYYPKLYRTVGANAKSLKVTKLRKNTYYKFYVIALDSNGKRLATTECHHFCTNNVSGKYTNPRNIRASKAKVTVRKGKTAKLTATVSKVKSNKTLTNGSHTQKVRYRSGNTRVATVTKNGVIRGVGTGWCRVYVMSANGIWQTVEVTVN